MHLKSLGNFTNAINEGKQLGSMLAISANASKVLESSLKDLSAVQILAKTSSLKLSEAQKIELIQLYATDKANYENITSTAALSAAQKEAAVSTGSLKAAFKGLTATMATNPLFAASALIAGVYGIVKVINYFASATERAKEAALNSADAYKEADDALKSLNTELETSRARIEELESLPSLSFIEQEELDKLKKTTVELERQLAAKEQLAKHALAESRKDTLEYLNKKTTYDTYMGLEDLPSEYGESPYKVQDYETVQYSPLDMLEYQLDKYEGLIQRKGDLDSKLLEIEKEAVEGYETSPEYTNLKLDLSAVENEIEKLNGIIPNAIIELQTLDDSLDLDKDGEYIEQINSINDAYGSLFKKEQSVTGKFNAIWDSSEFASAKSELEELARSGELTPAKLESNEKYRVLLEKTGVTAEQVASHINSVVKEEQKLANVPINLSFKDSLTALPFDKLEELVALFKSGIIDEKTISSYDELNAIMKETGLNAEEATAELKEFTKGYTLPSEMISNLQEVSDLIDSLQKRKTTQIDTSSLEKIVKLYPEMESALSDYTAGLINEQQIIDDLQSHYDIDLQNYGNYLLIKNQNNLDFANTIGLNSSELVNHFLNDYGIDIGNHTTYAQKKIAIEQKTLQTISDMWSEYYNAQSMSLTDMGKTLEERVLSGEGSSSDIRFYNELKGQANKYKKYVDELNSIGYEGIGAKFDGIKSAGSGSKSGSKEKTAKEPTVFDYMQQKVDLLSAQVDKLKTNIDSLVGYKSKNSMTNTAIDVLTEKMSVLQQMHDKYMEEAGKLGLSQEYIDKIQNGSIEIESIADENLAKVIQEYQDLFEKAESANDQIIEVTQSIHELNLSKLDNIINQFEQMTDIQSQMIDTENQLLDLREKSGEEIYMDDYISLAGKQLNLTRQNADAYNTLAAEMTKMNLKEGSDDWKKYNDQLQEYKNNMISAADAVEQYKDAMKELAYKGLGDLKSAMDSINGTISTMNDLIGDTNLIDDFGKLTDRGLAQVALYAHQMTNAKQEAAEYAKAIESLDDALDSGLITQDEYNSMLHDYTSSQESAVKSSKEARDAILSLVKEGIQAEIDAKKKLVDETKAALDAEKDLHDYQNSIAKKQDNISKLERQIAALSNSTNRDDIAQRLQLQSQLADAKKELFEEQYDHEIEQRKEALDDEYESFEESKKKESDELDSNLDAQNAAINKYLEQVKANYSTVYNILTQYGNEYSLAAIKDLTDPWESGSNAADLCSNAIGDAVANIQYEINGLDFSPLYELVDLLEQIGLGGYGGDLSSAQYKDITSTGKWQKGQEDKWWFGEDYDPNGNYDYASGGIYTINGKQYGFDDEGYMQTGWNDEHGDWRYFEPENGEMVKSEWRKSSNGDWYYLDKDGVMATDMAVKAREDDGYYYLDNEGKWDGQTLSSEEVRKLGVRIGYRKGTANARKGWNLMDEDGLGSESIITDKGRLVQFKGGETVFNPEMTENLWELAQDPTKFVPGLCNISANTLDLSKVQPVQRTVEFNAPLFQVEGGLSSDMVGYIDQKCDWLKKNVGKLAYEDLENTLFGK